MPQGPWSARRERRCTDVKNAQSREGARRASLHRRSAMSNAQLERALRR